MLLRTSNLIPIERTSNTITGTGAEADRRNESQIAESRFALFADQDQHGAQDELLARAYHFADQQRAGVYLPVRWNAQQPE